jgi:hypothetical protein
MTVADWEVHLDEAAIEDMLNSPDGPVGAVIEELSDKAAAIAREAAPVMKPENFSHWGKYYDPRFQYGPPGRTKARVRSSFPRYNDQGQLYGGVNVPYGPTLFLERPARQIRGDYRFMTAALDGVEL